jgi:vacuolar-type H+-ATPase subunit D/Vma8
MLKHQLKEYCEAEFENIDTVVCELFSVVKTEKSEYSTAELAAIATFIYNCYNGIENILKRILSFNQIET